jgi:hypothetical protein
MEFTPRETTNHCLLPTGRGGIRQHAMRFGQGRGWRSTQPRIHLLLQQRLRVIIVRRTAPALPHTHLPHTQAPTPNPTRLTNARLQGASACVRACSAINWSLCEIAPLHGSWPRRIFGLCRQQPPCHLATCMRALTVHATTCLPLSLQPHPVCVYVCVCVCVA